MPDDLEKPSSSSLVRKLATILSADVAEFSRLMGEDEEGTLKIFRGHKQVFETLVAGHRGRIFNTAGDAILAEFGSAVEAVRCATDIQAALRTRNDQLPPNRQVRFRIGINLGDVMVHGQDLLGDGVNVAARLQTAAEPGGICISGSVHDQITNKLSLTFHSLGQMSFKNIQTPVRTFSITHAQGLGDLPSRHRAAGSSKSRWIAAALLLIAVSAGAAYWSLVGRPRRNQQLASVNPPPATQSAATPRQAPAGTPVQQPATTSAAQPEPNPGVQPAAKPANVLRQPDAASAATASPRKEAAPSRPATPAAAVPVSPASKSAGVAKQSVNAEDLYDKGVAAFKANEFSKATELYGKACEAGDPRACHALGLMYYHGRGVAEDLNRAASFYKRACDAGGSGGCFDLAVMYERGEGGPLDMTRAAGLYKRACDEGLPAACTDLGRLYRNGDGVPQDLNRAAAVFKQACDGGGLLGCLNLGAMYALGEGVARNQDRATELFQKACDGGVQRACQNLVRRKRAGR